MIQIIPICIPYCNIKFKKKKKKKKKKYIYIYIYIFVSYSSSMPDVAQHNTNMKHD